jgi:hypothetical protein
MPSEAIALGAPTVKTAATNIADAGLHCDECNSDEVHRIFRRGYFQEKIYPLLGFYPWRCKGCGLRLMMHERGSGEPAELNAANRF